MEPILMTAAGLALAEGVKFLYQQAGEFLKTWRARRRDDSSPPPKVLSPPPGVTVGKADPLPDPPSREAEDTLQELHELLEPVVDGTLPVEDEAARKAVAALRQVLETVLRAPITIGGEQPRATPVEADVTVVVQDVAGEVAGIRGELQAAISRVRVEAGDVQPGGSVTGIDNRP